MRKPEDFERQQMGVGNRFHVRYCKGSVWQVHGRGMEHICDCTRVEMAEMVVDALELVAELHESPLKFELEDEDNVTTTTTVDVHFSRPG